MTLTVNDTFSGFSPLVIGVNLGHHYPQEGSWLAYLEHLGVNGARPVAQLARWPCAMRTRAPGPLLRRARHGAVSKKRRGAPSAARSASARRALC